MNETKQEKRGALRSLSPPACLVLSVRVALGVPVDVRPAQEQRDDHDHEPLKLEQHDPRDEQAHPQDGGSVQPDPEELVVGAVDLRHVLQGLEHPLRASVLLDVAPPPEPHLFGSVFQGIQRLD